ncbi:hypothetical protein ACGFX8_25285 [Streptomyces sp. NPDC048362]
MTARWPVRRPTEHAALLDASERRDLEGICLAVHRVARAASPKEFDE